MGERFRQLCNRVVVHLLNVSSALVILVALAYQQVVQCEQDNDEGASCQPTCNFLADEPAAVFQSYHHNVTSTCHLATGIFVAALVFSVLFAANELYWMPTMAPHRFRQLSFAEGMVAGGLTCGCSVISWLVVFAAMDACEKIKHDCGTAQQQHRHPACNDAKCTSLHDIMSTPAFVICGVGTSSMVCWLIAVYFAMRRVSGQDTPEAVWRQDHEELLDDDEDDDGEGGGDGEGVGGEAYEPPAPAPSGDGAVELAEI